MGTFFYFDLSTEHTMSDSICFNTTSSLETKSINSLVGRPFRMEESEKNYECCRDVEYKLINSDSKRKQRDVCQGVSCTLGGRDSPRSSPCETSFITHTPFLHNTMRDRLGCLCAQCGDNKSFSEITRNQKREKLSRYIIGQQQQNHIGFGWPLYPNSSVEIQPTG